MMNDTRIIPHGACLSGSVILPPSKSELHRMLIALSLCPEGGTIVETGRLSDDVCATIDCLSALGAGITVSDNGITVYRPLDLSRLPQRVVLDCRESASTARFLLPLLSFFAPGARLDGGGSLRKRSMAPLCECLKEAGAICSSDTLPLMIEKTAVPGGILTLDGTLSSQFLSGLFFILPFLGDTAVELKTPLASAGYAGMTASILRRFGVAVQTVDRRYTASGIYKTPDDLVVGGDWSAAACLVCGMREGASVTLYGADSQSAQPDRALLDLLKNCGMTVGTASGGVTVKREKELVPFEADADEVPDLILPLAVLAASIPGESRFFHTGRLRTKESDRESAILTLIRDAGGNASFDGDTITVCGGAPLKGGCVIDGRGDHRVVMAAAGLAAFCREDLTVTSADAVKKSYPSFFDDLEALSGGIR